MFSIWSGREAVAPKASNDGHQRGTIDDVATSSQRCKHDVVTACPHCAAIAAAEERRCHLEPDYLEPAEHAQLVFEALQDSGRYGNVLARDISALYPKICEQANVVEIPTRDLLRELGKIAKKSRLTMKFETGSTSTRTAYFIPKPKGAKVVAMKRRGIS